MRRRSKEHGGPLQGDLNKDTISWRLESAWSQYLKNEYPTPSDGHDPKSDDVVAKAEAYAANTKINLCWKPELFVEEYAELESERQRTNIN